MRSFYLFLITLNYLLAQLPIPSAPFNDGSWFLEFNEDFDSLSSKHWNVKHLYNNGNYEAVMLKDNVSIENGNLVLTLKKEYKNVSHLPHGCKTGLTLKEYDFTGGWVESKALFGYGYYEIRFKCDLAEGFYPAIWMLNTYPHYQEIDLLETNFGAKFKTSGLPCSLFGTGADHLNNYYMFTSNIHFHDAASSPTEIGDDEQYPKIIKNVNFLNYNVIGFEWLPNRMSLYLNGLQKWSINLPIPCQILPTQQFNLPVGIIFDVHVDYLDCSCIGKQLYEEPNIPNNSFTGQSYNSVLPNNEQPKLYIDYFRYYRYKEGCNNMNVSVNCYDFMNHTNSVKNSYSIGPCVAHTPNTQANSHYIFRAIQSVDLNGEFILPLGSAYTFDVADYCQSFPVGVENCNQNFIQCNYDFSIFQNTIKNSIEIGGNNCADYIAPYHNNIEFKAREYIHLKEGFGVAPESNFGGKILNCN